MCYLVIEKRLFVGGGGYWPISYRGKNTKGRKEKVVKSERKKWKRKEIKVRSEFLVQ
jgi:hypothetical protein